MNHNLQLLIVVFSVLLFQACAPRVKVSVSNAAYPSLKNDATVFVIQSEDLLPVNSEYLGQLKAGDTGLSVDCGYQNIIEAAKAEARTKGANIISISSIKEPNLWSTCYRITARLLFNNSTESLTALEAQLEAKNKSTLPKDAAYAIIHFYRPSYYTGSLIRYSIKDSEGKVLGKMKSGSSFQYKTTNFGEQTFMSGNETESVTLNIQPGQEYFLRCGIRTGFPVAKPDFYLVDNTMGYQEYSEM